jgi:hypothetical protein
MSLIIEKINNLEKQIDTIKTKRDRYVKNSVQYIQFNRQIKKLINKKISLKKCEELKNYCVVQQFRKDLEEKINQHDVKYRAYMHIVDMVNDNFKDEEIKIHEEYQQKIKKLNDQKKSVIMEYCEECEINPYEILRNNDIINQIDEETPILHPNQFPVDSLLILN